MKLSSVTEISLKLSKNLSLDCKYIVIPKPETHLYFHNLVFCYPGVFVLQSCTVKLVLLEQRYYVVELSWSVNQCGIAEVARENEEFSKNIVSPMTRRDALICHNEAASYTHDALFMEITCVDVIWRSSYV